MRGIRGSIAQWVAEPPPWLRQFGNRLAQFVSVVLLGVPRPLGYWVSDRFGDYFFRRNANLRANHLDNMRHVIGPYASEGRVQWATRRAFRMQARNGFDLLRVPRVSLRRLAQQVVMDGDWAEIEAVLGSGRGVILCSAHYGAFDIMGQYVINRGYDAWLLVGRTTSVFVHDAVTYLRQSRGWRIVPVEDGGSIRRMMKAVKGGAMAAMVVDRDWAGNGVSVPFFGTPTPLPTGHIRVALATNAEVFTMMSPRLSRNRYGFILRHVPLQRTGNTAADIAENTQRVLANFETVITDDPGQWVLFRPVWSHLPAPATPNAQQ